MSKEDNSLQVKRISLVDAVVEQMIEAIKIGKFKPGEKIPSEKVLTQEFGVSRTTLREAFKKLENIGAISIRQGSGTYLLDLDHLNEHNAKPDPDIVAVMHGEQRSAVQDAIRAMFTIGNYQLTHYLEARECIENTAIDLAAKRITQADREAIEDILERQVQCDTPEQYLELDYEFHTMVIMASKNEFLYQFWQALSPFVREQISKANVIPGMIENASSNHRKIFNALVNGDSKRANTINVDHLRIVQGRMLSEAAKRVGETSGDERSQV